MRNVSLVNGGLIHGQFLKKEMATYLPGGIVSFEVGEHARRGL
jgi:hypothetical protein